MALAQVLQIGPTIPLPPPEHISGMFFHVFEIAAISLGALGGALSVRRELKSRYDVIGLLGLGLLSGVGGGILRDVLLGNGPPLALQNASYLLYALAGAATAILFGHTVGPRMLAFMNVVDALALGMFSVSGATRALNAELGLLPCLMLGVTTAVGGGALKDVFSGKAPATFQEGELYALVATVAAAIFLLSIRLGVPVDRAATIGTTVGFGLRLLAIRYGWRTRAIGPLA